MTQECTQSHPETASVTRLLALASAVLCFALAVAPFHGHGSASLCCCWSMYHFIGR